MNENIDRIGDSIVIVSKESIIKKDISGFEKFIDIVSVEELRNGQENYSTVELSIDGYNDDPRSLWDIPEVRNWFKVLQSKRPYALYFLSSSSIQIYLLCLEPISQISLPKEYSKLDDPFVGFLSYQMQQFLKFLSGILPKMADDGANLVEIANDRVLSAAKGFLNDNIAYGNKTKTKKRWWQFWKTEDTEIVDTNKQNAINIALNKPKDFSNKIKKCLNCNTELLSSQLQCPDCGSIHFIWE